MAEELTTAAVFGDHTQAIAARLYLEAAGIPAFLADEMVAGSIFLWSPAVGGIKLQVPESRLEEAVRLLDDKMPGEPGTTDWSNVDVGTPDEDIIQHVHESPPAVRVNSTPRDSNGLLTLREQQAE